MPARKVWSGNDSLARRLVPIAELHAHPRNPRRGVVPEIQKSLRRFGQQRAVLTLPDGTIVAGNHVVKAAAAEEWTHVAVDTSDLTEAEVDAYLLADNRLGDLGVYDDFVLAEVLRHSQEHDELLGTGYTSSDVDRLLARVSPAEALDQSTQLDRMFFVIVTCADETQQTSLMERLELEGFVTKLAIS